MYILIYMYTLYIFRYSINSISKRWYQYQRPSSEAFDFAAVHPGPTPLCQRQRGHPWENPIVRNGWVGPHPSFGKLVS